jgi:hypothetical protein
MRNALAGPLHLRLVLPLELQVFPVPTCQRRLTLNAWIFRVLSSLKIRRGSACSRSASPVVQLHNICCEFCIMLHRSQTHRDVCRLDLNMGPSVGLDVPPGLGVHKPSVLQFNNASDRCPGAFFNFGHSMFRHYPWHLHDEGLLPYEFSFIDPKGRYFYVQSPKCTQKSPGGSGLACDACSRVVITKQFQDIVQRAAPGHMFPPTANTLYRTWSQLNDLLDEKAVQINKLKLQVCCIYRCAALYYGADNAVVRSETLFAAAHTFA